MIMHDVCWYIRVFPPYVHRIGHTATQRINGIVKIDRLFRSVKRAVCPGAGDRGDGYDGVASGRWPDESHRVRVEGRDGALDELVLVLLDTGQRRGG